MGQNGTTIKICLFLRAFITKEGDAANDGDGSEAIFVIVRYPHILK